MLLHSNKSFVCTCFCFLDGHVEEPRGPGGRADKDHQVKAFLDAPSSLLDNLKESGGDTVVEGETAEVWQLPKYQDNLSRVRCLFIMRPCSCCASSWLRCYFITPSSSLFWCEWTLQTVNNANQHPLCRAKLATRNKLPTTLCHLLPTCYLSNF